MSKNLTGILLVLVLLTIGGLLLVSNFISEKKSGKESAAVLSATNTPKIAQSPLIRRSATAKELGPELQTAESQLTEISEAIKANDWGRAQNGFNEFALKDHRLPSPQLHHPYVSPLLQDFFDLYVVQLERSINEKQAKNANLALSQLFGIVGEAQARFIPGSIPVEVQRLHHLLREISLWKDAGDDKMLQTRKAALSEAWDDVSSLVRTKPDGDKVAEKFGSLVTQVVSADTPQKFATLVPDLKDGLDAVDELFQKSTDDDDDDQ